MAPKPGRVVTCNEEFPSIQSHDPLITWSGDFSYTICRFRMKTPKSSPISCSPSFASSSPQLFWNIGEFGP